MQATATCTTDNIKKNLEALHQYTSTPGNGTTRLPFTKEARAGVDDISVMMKEVGLTVYEDEAGNVIGTLKGTDPTLPAIVIGSHFDTVTSGGDFDGLAGIETGIEIVRMIGDNKISLKRNLIVIGFCDEEGMRFGTGYFGSKALLGQVTQEEIKRFKDKDGVSVYDAMVEYGLVPENLPKAAWDLSKIKAFIEMHIEQGPVLDQCNIELGLVDCIVGIQRYIITVKGRADHAGTTPMDMRIDAVETATKVISRIPDWAREKGGGCVATTGFMKVLPGGMNIVAEEVQFSVDVRSTNNDDLLDIVAKIRTALDEECAKNCSTYTMDNKLTIVPVALCKDLLDRLQKSCETRNYTYRRMPSGAGHDSLAIGQVLDTVMVFVPSKDGRSHCPVEWTEYTAIEKAINVIYDLVLGL